MNNLPDKELFRPDEVACFLGVSRQTIYLWIKTGILPAKKIGKRLVRIHRESLKELQKDAIE